MCDVWNGNRYPDVFDVKLAVSRLVEHDDRYQDCSYKLPVYDIIYFTAEYIFRFGYSMDLSKVRKCCEVQSC